jgi:hypothetical protein
MRNLKLIFGTLGCFTLIQLASLSPAFAKSAGSSKSKKIVTITYAELQKAAKKPVARKKKPAERQVVSHHYSQRSTDSVNIEPLDEKAKKTRRGLPQAKKAPKRTRADRWAERGPDSINRVGKPMPEKVILAVEKPQPIRKAELDKALKEMGGFEDQELLSELEESL